MRVYAPNAVRKYHAFADDVNDALQRVGSTTESAVLLGNFDALFGKDNKTWKGMIAWYGDSTLKENCRYVLQFVVTTGSAL